MKRRSEGHILEVLHAAYQRYGVTVKYNSYRLARSNHYETNHKVQRLAKCMVHMMKTHIFTEHDPITM